MMKRVLILIALSAVISAWGAEDVSIADHYKKACALRDQGNYSAAIEEVARGIALNSQERDLLAKSELLCAGLYLKLDKLESAAVIARQVEMLYKGTEFEAEAKTLQEEIKQLTEQSKETE